MMPPSSWYRLEEFAQLEAARRRAAARHRDHSSTRRRERRRRPERCRRGRPCGAPHRAWPWRLSAAGRMLAVTARILDGKAIAAQIRSRGSRAGTGPRRDGHHPGPGRRPRGRRPGLSHLRRRRSTRRAPTSGSVPSRSTCPSYVTEHELLATIRRLNRDPEIHGIIVQLPAARAPQRAARCSARSRPRRTSTACIRGTSG